MKKTLKIIFIILLVALFAMFLIWLINPGTQNRTVSNFVGRVREFIPLGGNQPSIEDGVDQNNNGDLNGNEEGEFFSGGESLVDGKRSIDATLPNIEQVYKKPTAGFTILGTSTPILRLVEKETGHIIDVNTQTQETVRVSNTTLPGIREAIFFANGNSVILRYARQNSNTIETIIIDNIGRDTQTAGTYLEENIISILPINASTLVYVSPYKFGSKIYTFNTKSNKRVEVTELSFREVTLIGGDNSSVYIKTNPSFRSFGYVFNISLNTGVLEKVTGDQGGFDAIINDKNNALYSTYNSSVGSGQVLDLNIQSRVDVDLRTIASKCAFTDEVIYCGVPTLYGQNMPDNWFMGLTDLDDNLWAINSASGNDYFIVDLTDIDITLPAIKENNMFFVNKNDSTPWVVRIGQILTN